MDSKPFDSQLFGIKVFRTDDPEPSDAWERTDLLYVFTQSPLPPPTLARYHGHLVDQRRDYRKTLVTCPDFEPRTDESTSYADVRGAELKAEDRTALHSLAIRSGYTCRYRNDPYLPGELFEKLYRRWMDNSIAGKVAYAVLVARQESRIVGVITLQEQDRQTSNLGLVAVAKQYSGRGIGTRLLQFALRTVWQKRGHRRISSVTHGQDPAACRYYERQGFVLHDECNVYHLWPRGPLLVKNKGIGP